ncbi:MAG: thioredoxin family protein [Acidobacteriota bacterium]|nr:thioredoxin family protein [Acidobacteriota bacterium]
MTTRRMLATLATLILISTGNWMQCNAQQGAEESKANIALNSGEAYTPVHAFDTKRDAVKDIQAAIAEAERTRKRIILYVGGDWCPYCAQLVMLYRADPTLLALRDRRFITVYVFYGPENRNEKALRRYGKVLGVPHYFVLNSNGELLHSQHLLELRTAGSYSPEKFRSFFEEWAPGGKLGDRATGK